MTVIERPQRSDWQVFQLLADQEGWRVPELELELFQNIAPDSAAVARQKECCRGFVTALGHQRSGWIGNLIVARDSRGCGVGQRLFLHAVKQLQEQGVEEQWLTASAQGCPLYERHGFRSVGRIRRWFATGTGEGKEVFSSTAVADLQARDQSVWGEQRSCLLDYLCSRGRILSVGGSCALLQRDRHFDCLGPWYSDVPRYSEAVDLLGQARALTPAGKELVLDAYPSAVIEKALRRVGFQCRGETELMVRGEAPVVDFRRLHALASLGSMG